jgi:hypothetical protein
MTLRRGPLAILLFGAVAFAATASETPAQTNAPSPSRIAISSTPIDVFSRGEAERRRFGSLEFRGGLILASTEENFGGISGIRVAPDGTQFLAITDRSDWLRGNLVSNGDKPAGIADAEIAPMRAAGGTLAKRGWFDTEAIAADGDTIYVGIERVHRIVRFDFAKGGLAAPARPIDTPGAFRELPGNQGIEGMVFVPKDRPLGGTLIAISERGLDKAGNIRGFLIGGAMPGEFTIRRRDEFDVTDAALIPGGDLLVLERHFSFLRGVGMRIRRIPLEAIKPGALIDGEALIQAGNAHQIDNMEAMAVHKNAAGETIITLVSDDNFSRLQQTILLRFALIED